MITSIMKHSIMMSVIFSYIGMLIVGVLILFCLKTKDNTIFSGFIGFLLTIILIAIVCGLISKAI